MKSNSVGFIPALLKDFGVTSEHDLAEKLSMESQFISCCVCGKDMPIEKLNFSTGDPICKKHFQK